MGSKITRNLPGNNAGQSQKESIQVIHSIDSSKNIIESSLELLV